MSFVVGILVLISRDVSVAGRVLSASNTLALAGFIKSLLVTSRVPGSVGQPSDCIGSFSSGLQIDFKLSEMNEAKVKQTLPSLLSWIRAHRILLTSF